MSKRLRQSGVSSLSSNLGDPPFMRQSFPKTGLPHVPDPSKRLRADLTPSSVGR